MEKITRWTSWNINIAIDEASDITLAETEKEIQKFIEELTGFEYYELVIDKINWNKDFNLRSVNNN